jgi:hypothetical protein
MKQVVPFRILVSSPLAGVVMMVQRGRDDLLPPVDATSDEMRFEFEIDVDVLDAGLNFLGK